MIPTLYDQRYYKKKILKLVVPLAFTLIVLTKTPLNKNGPLWCLLLIFTYGFSVLKLNLGWLVVRFKSDI